MAVRSAVVTSVPHDVVCPEGELVGPEAGSARAGLARPDGNVGDRVVEDAESVQLGGGVQARRYLTPDAEPGRREPEQGARRT
jgi:hypothetical protein